MKTKVRELKENIARYIYEYIGSGDISIYFDKSQSPTNSFTSTTPWVIYNKDRILDSELTEKLFELSDLLGIKFGFGIPNKYATLLWNKEKEEKYLKIRKEQELRHQKLHDFLVELDYFSFPLELFNKVIKTTMFNDKK